jgi:hypothetical protein
VIVKITKVERTGEIEKKSCVVSTGYKATLEVQKVLKGKRQKQLELFFNEDRFLKGCVGSPDTIHYEGEEAKYYLRCQDKRCHLTHYNGVEYIKQGENQPPKSSINQK